MKIILTTIMLLATLGYLTTPINCTGVSKSGTYSVHINQVDTQLFARTYDEDIIASMIWDTKQLFNQELNQWKQ